MSHFHPSNEISKVQKKVTPEDMTKYVPIRNYLETDRSFPFPVDSVIVAVVSSHSDDGVVYGADGEPIYIGRSIHGKN